RESIEMGNEAHDVRAFKAFVRDVAANVTPAPMATVRIAADSLRIAPNGNAKNYAILGVPGNIPTRWPGCVSPPDPCTGNATVSVSFKHTAADPSGGITAGLASWTNDPNSFVTLTDGGLFTGSPSPNQNDNTNVIYLNGTPNTGLCDGAQACTIGAGNFTNNFDCHPWISISDAYIVLSPNAPSASSVPSLINHQLCPAIL